MFTLYIFWGWGVEKGFLCVALPRLKLNLYIRLASNSENQLPLPPSTVFEGVYYHD